MKLPPLPPVTHLELTQSPRRKFAPTPDRAVQAEHFRALAAARAAGRTKDVAHWEDYLVRVNVGLIGRMVQVARKRYSAIDDDPNEAFSVSLGALLRAVRYFDVERGFTFSTFACRIINNALSHHALNASRRPGGMTWCKRAAMPVVGSLGDKAEGWWIDPAAPEAADFSEEREALTEALRHNTPRLTTQERVVLRHRFLGEKETCEAVGKRLGVSKERVRQLQIRVITKLRAVLNPPD